MIVLLQHKTLMESMQLLQCGGSVTIIKDNLNYKQAINLSTDIRQIMKYLRSWFHFREFRVSPALYECETEGREVELMPERSYYLPQQRPESSQIVVFVGEEVLEYLRQYLEKKAHRYRQILQNHFYSLNILFFMYFVGRTIHEFKIRTKC